MTRLLVVDDDPEITRTLSIALRARDFDVDTVSRGSIAIDEAAAHTYDFIILDLGLPDVDGLRVIRAVREISQVPILILSGRNDLTNKIDALDAGADDYLTKPFSLDELLARLRALGRRGASERSDAVVTMGEITVDLARHVAFRGDDELSTIHLTSTEWDLLEALLRRPGRLIARRTLLREVWGRGYADDSNHLRVYMARLRSKLEKDPARPRYLLNEHGMGYRFTP